MSINSKPLNDLVRVEVSAADVGDYVTKIVKALEGTTNGTAVVSCLATAIIIQNPDISIEELVETVADTSQWMATYIELKASGTDTVTH